MNAIEAVNEVNKLTKRIDVMRTVLTHLSATREYKVEVNTLTEIMEELKAERSMLNSKLAVTELKEK